MDIDYGQILPAPTDARYQSTRNYMAMETCYDEWQSEWLSLDDNNLNHPIPGYNSDGSAKVSDWWRCLVNVYRAERAAQNADEKATLANEKATLANNAATNANDKATYAKTQGDYAKNIAEHPTYVGDDGYVYRWNYSEQRYVRGAYVKGEGINYSTMSAAEKQELHDAVIEEAERNGGFMLYPVELASISTTSVFQKNSIICIDGVVYRAKQQTSNLPVVLVAENNRFITQVVNGYTVFIKANNTLSSDWEVWLDASSDFRYKSIEARVAKLETLAGL